MGRAPLLVEGNNLLDSSMNAAYSEATSSLASLICGYGPEIVRRKLIVSLQAFVDDSSSEIDGRNMVLAGYVHSADRWLRFSEDWELALNEKPRIEYFRMSEAQNLSGQFRNFTRDQQVAKTRTLGNVIRWYSPKSFECWVSKKSFDRIVKPVAPYDLKNPYMVCFYGAIVTLARFHAEEGIRVPVDFVFDEQGGLGAFVLLWYEWIKGWQDPQISALLGSSPIFRNDKSILPLQAADMLAWHLRRRKESRRAAEERPLMKDILSHHVEATITDEVLEMLARKMSSVPGIKETQSKKSSIRHLLRGRTRQ